MDPRLERAREIMRSEAEAIARVGDALDSRFLEVVEAVLRTRGKIVVTGVGKSGLIGQKIAATLSSTGTPALFLHSVEAVHGDLGIVSPDDLVLAISRSGETSEVLNVVFAARGIGAAVVSMTSELESTLALESEHVIPLGSDGEAGHLGLAPTTSAAVTLALGDALAMVLSEEKKLSAEQFAVFHPGGSLGRRLSLKVADIMRTRDSIPVVTESCSIERAIDEMTEKGLGVTLVVNADGCLSGIVTDGDVRRLWKQGRLSSSEDPVSTIMVAGPKTVERDALASEGLRLMEMPRAITSLAIVDSHGAPEGILHLHDILGRGKIIL